MVVLQALLPPPSLSLGLVCFPSLPFLPGLLPLLSWLGHERCGSCWLVGLGRVANVCVSGVWCVRVRVSCLRVAAARWRVCCVCALCVCVCVCVCAWGVWCVLSLLACVAVSAFLRRRLVDFFKAGALLLSCFLLWVLRVLRLRGGGVWAGRGFGGVVWVGGWCVGGVGFGLGWWVVAGGGGWLAALRSCVHAPVLRPFLLSLLALVKVRPALSELTARTT